MFASCLIGGLKLCPQEEEDGSEDDSNMKLDLTVTLKADFNVRSFLDQLEDDADGFVSPVDDRFPSRSSQDMGLSNLHAASMYVTFLGVGIVCSVFLQKAVDKCRQRVLCNCSRVVCSS